MREYFTDCREGQHYSDLLGCRLGYTSEEITRRNLWREALCQMAEDFFQFSSKDGSLLCSKGHFDERLRAWLYCHIAEAKIRERLRGIFINGEEPTNHVLYDDQEAVDWNDFDWFSCPICSRDFEVFRHDKELPICCGEHVIDFPGYIYGYGPYYDPSRVLTEARAEYLAAILYPGGTL